MWLSSALITVITTLLLKYAYTIINEYFCDWVSKNSKKSHKGCLFEITILTENPGLIYYYGPVEIDYNTFDRT